MVDPSRQEHISKLMYYGKLSLAQAVKRANTEDFDGIPMFRVKDELEDLISCGWLKEKK